MGRSIGGHHRASQGYSEDWLTPPELLSRLGSFDLDPCTPPVMPWSTAMNRFTPEDDGLSQRWPSGRVWLNPPYGRATGRWLRRLAAHGDGIALVFARTETRMFFRHVWSQADALLFLKGRVSFRRIDGSPAGHNSGGPSVLIAYGQRNVDSLVASALPGVIVRLEPDRREVMPLFASDVHR